MQVSRILPDLQCSLLCDDIRQQSDGNFIIIGIYNSFVVPQVPVTAFRLCVFNRWTAGVGTFTESVRIIAPDQTTLLRKSERKFELKDASGNSTNITFFGQLEFKTAGIYFIEVLVDDVMKLRYPVPMIIAPQNPNAPAPQATPEA